MSLYDENVAKGLKAGGSFPASPKREDKNILPQEYNFQKEPRRNYEVLFVKFSDIDIKERGIYYIINKFVNVMLLKRIICCKKSNQGVLFG